MQGSVVVATAAMLIVSACGGSGNSDAAKWQHLSDSTCAKATPTANAHRCRCLYDYMSHHYSWADVFGENGQTGPHFDAAQETAIARCSGT